MDGGKALEDTLIENNFLDAMIAGEQAQTDIQLVAESGLGYGQGPISTRAQIAKGTLSEEALSVALQILKHDPSVFVHVETLEDNCSDGRLIGLPTDQDYDTMASNSRLAKIFGGGLTVASSMWRAVEGIPATGETMNGDWQYIASLISETDIKFGVHFDTHHSLKGTSMCRCIEQYRSISRQIVTSRYDIETHLKLLYGDGYVENKDAIEFVYQVYADLPDSYFHYDVKQVRSLVESRRGGIIDRPRPKYEEDFIIFNDREHTTYDQRLLDDRLIDKGITNLFVQGFSIDAWRGRQYAELIADLHLRVHPDSDAIHARKVAYADFMIRTLTTLANFTAGDLPVFVRLSKSKHDLSFWLRDVKITYTDQLS